MYQYQFEKLQATLPALISTHSNPGSWEWLTESSINAGFENLAMTFGLIPRKTGRKLIALSADQVREIDDARPSFSIKGWSVDRLARVWLLLQLPTDDKDLYVNSIMQLFQNAEVNELVALYSALPVLAYPEAWVAQCSEGIRNNISDVLQSIMCDNPYPEENLDEAAWNQLVLKAFFTEKPIQNITGLDKRTNLHLANTLSDYAHERWAAHRLVNPQLWRCVGMFLNKDLFGDILRLEATGNPVELEAAALACSAALYPDAQEWLQNHPTQKSAIESGTLTWKSIAEKSIEYVL